MELLNTAGMEMYQSQLYFADNTAIYRRTDISSDSSFEKIALPFDKRPSFGYLHSDGRYLRSVGSRDIIQFDGNQWSTVFGALRKCLSFLFPETRAGLVHDFALRQ